MEENSKDIPLTPRAEALLKSLIQKYIADGQPVGSRTLARETGLDLSPATIRNIMADLEELGFIKAPHTSAGRVPTQLGYRLFVDTMLNVRPLDPAVISELTGTLGVDHDPVNILAKASDVLSQLTHFAGVVMAPRRDHTRLKQIEFINLSKDRILSILVTDDGRVQNRVLTVDRPFESHELVQAANFFNEFFGGEQVAEVHRKLLVGMEQDSEAMNSVMQTAVSMARQFFDDGNADRDNVVVSGEANLLEVPELSELEKLRELFQTFKTKQDLLELLDKSLKASGISIFIGGESGYAPLNDCSVITSPYEVDGNLVGVLGVIGPTRMSYSDVIPVVDITARLVGSALSSPAQAERLT